MQTWETPYWEFWLDMEFRIFPSPIPSPAPENLLSIPEILTTAQISDLAQGKVQLELVNGDLAQGVTGMHYGTFAAPSAAGTLIPLHWKAQVWVFKQKETCYL